MTEERDHTSREIVQRFFRSELPRGESREILRHLLTRCPDCLDLALHVGKEEGLADSSGDFQNAPFSEAPESYYRVFLRLMQKTDDLDAELARERLRGVRLWIRLEKHPHDRRLMIVKNYPRMHSWGLYERLIEKAREQGFCNPAEAVELAHLALAVADELDPGHYGRERVADFQAEALATLGNAQRLASDFSAAEESFLHAREVLAQGTGNPLEKASLLSLKASLLKDLGEFERAVLLLNQAIAIYRELNDLHLEGRILLQQAATIGFVHPERGAELAESGLALIDPRREPRLKLCGVHSFAYFLNDAGQPRKALSVLEKSRPIYAHFGDAWTRVRLLWLEGKIARSLGDLARAEEIFQRLWLDLHEPVYAHELTLLSVELAEVYVARGRRDDAARLLADFRPMLRLWGMHTEELAVWLLLQKAG